VSAGFFINEWIARKVSNFFLLMSLLFTGDIYHRIKASFADDGLLHQLARKGEFKTKKACYLNKPFP
jgi:hypothetical protein